MTTAFTPVSALLGGALIGLAATLLYALLGASPVSAVSSTRCWNSAANAAGASPSCSA